MVSTDSARLVVISHDSSNALQWFFSTEDFFIRPDPGLGIQPSVVTMTYPSGGHSFAGGSTVTSSGRRLHNKESARSIFSTPRTMDPPRLTPLPYVPTCCVCFIVAILRNI